MLIIWDFVRSDTVLSLQQSHLWTLYIEGSQKSVHHLDKNPGLLCTVVHEHQSSSYTLITCCDKQASIKALLHMSWTTQNPHLGRKIDPHSGVRV